MRTADASVQEMTTPRCLEVEGKIRKHSVYMCTECRIHVSSKLSNVQYTLFGRSCLVPVLFQTGDDARFLPPSFGFSLYVKGLMVTAAVV